MEIIKVKDHSNLVRDKNSKAILCTDNDSLNKYKEEREYKLKIKNIVDSQDDLNNRLNNIEKLLLKILEGNNKICQ